MKRASFRANISRIDYRGVILAQDFENKLLNLCMKPNFFNQPLLIDFRNANYIEIATLINFISLLRYGQERELEIFIGYPKYHNVRDFLTVWRFKEAVEFVLGKGFETILVEEDHGYLNEKQISYNGIGDGIDKLEYDSDVDMHSGVKRNFFEFISFNTQSNKDKYDIFYYNFDIARNEADRWSGSLIDSVLKKHLTPDANNSSIIIEDSVIKNNDVARVIILEALNNSILHPNAKVIQTVSIFNRKLEKSKLIKKYKLNKSKLKKIQGTLRICIWDDGDSIASTLLRPLKENKKVKVKTNIEKTQHRNYYVEYCKSVCHNNTIKNENLRAFIVNENDSFNKKEKETEARALLYSLFPGITRTASFSDNELPRFTVNEDKDKQVRGMGLYNLKCAVIDQNYGTILIRSGHYRLYIKPAKSNLAIKYKVQYIAKLTQYPNFYPKFYGNLIVIQLPIT